MKYSTPILLASAGWASALKQQCSGTATNEGGNWYCGAVNQIVYEGIKGAGKFKAVTHMSDSGECHYEDKHYSGPLAPLDEDLSIHIRGPISVKEVAVYNLAAHHGKRDVEADEADNEPKAESSPQVADAHPAHNHGHGHGHKHLHRHAQRDKVFATINGKVVSWENNWFGPPPAAQPPTTPPAAKPAAGAALKADNPDKSAGSDKPKAQLESQSESKPKSESDRKHKGKPAASGSDWDRVAYYNAEKQIAENMIFMGNYGGSGSGVFDTTWGASLSYLNANGDGGASSPQILSDTLIPSNKEFAIFSAEKCDGSCGFTRAKDVAYKGFGGANKVFLFHFKMPLDGDRSFNGDMPALWALNGRIPRTAQYNACSCWQTGCGEADIYEVLTSGDTKCKSTFHLANGAGSSDYFDRPVDKYIKVAAVFHEKTASVSIKKLSDDVDFSKGLDDATVMKWLSQPKEGTARKMSSLFQLLEGQ
ncbi:hypothetical protein E4U34_006579 [Claviceps purpurea]|nr:hypothetical protein E4U34_006579 [Claviceps purpurea]KAG6274146.1 hypothetical protein E4U49_005796 [Claviceps purpurea]